ncbi:MAG: hypothetical protein ACOX0E_00580 [Syntrophomonadaceae bacterium]|jgi:hypothetical protein
MDTISKKYIWCFFGILIAVMVAAFLINTLYPPETKIIPQDQQIAIILS